MLTFFNIILADRLYNEQNYYFMTPYSDAKNDMKLSKEYLLFKFQNYELMSKRLLRNNSTELQDEIYIEHKSTTHLAEYFSSPT